MKRSRCTVVSLLLLTACGEVPQAVTSPPGAPELARTSTWSAWSPATPLGEIDTPTATEGCPKLVRSGNVLYLASNRPGGYGALDLYVSRWDGATNAWGPPVNLGPRINTAANEQCPLPLQNGKALIFVSNRAGGVGALDLWITRMHDQRDDESWETPENLSVLNSVADEFGPGEFQEHGRTVLYFNSNRPGGAGRHDLYVSTEQHDGSFPAPTLVAGLNTASDEQFPALGKDGLEIVFASDRPGTLGGLDLWHATRPSTSAAWGTPVNLGPQVNSPAGEGRSTLSWDGTTLIFHSNRAGSVDLYQTTRAHTAPQ